MARSSGDMDFGIHKIDGDELVEGATQFNYLGRPLDQFENDCPKISENQEETGGLGWLVKLLQWEGAYIHISEIFYWAVVQEVMLFRF